jgi:hypothetical protein
MKLELKVLGTLRTYCTRPNGQYPAPADFLTLGPPDMPVKSIEVESHKTYQTKTVTWFYPYKRLAINTEGGPMERFTVPLHCKSPRISESDATEQHIKIRSLITNGNQTKYVFDCKRGMMSLPMLGEDDPAKATMYSVQGGGFESHYFLICCRVTHESPYLPE